MKSPLLQDREPRTLDLHVTILFINSVLVGKARTKKQKIVLTWTNALLYVSYVKNTRKQTI